MFLRILTIAITFFVTITQLLSQDIDEIVKKTLLARGDVEVYKNLKSLIMSGTQSQMGVNFPYKFYYKKINNDKEKIYYEAEIMGTKQIVGFNGDTLWASDGTQTQIIPEEYREQTIAQIAQVKNFSETPFYDYKEEGHKLELSGSVNEDGRDAYTIRFIQNEERESYIYVDKNNFELFKIFTNTTGPKGDEIEVELTYKDYKKVNGFSIPHSMVLKMEGFGSLEYLIEKVEFNPVIDDSIFNMPKGTK